MKAKIQCLLNRPKVMIALSAVLTALPLTFDRCFLLSWVAFVPLFVTLIRGNGAKKLRVFVGRWFLFGLLFNLCIYYWFGWLYPLDFLGLTNSMSVTVVVFAWLTVSLLHSLPYVLPGILCYICSRKSDRGWLKVFAGIVGILVALRITEYGDLAFPWIRIALGHYRAPVLIQSASLWGVEGLDFIILTVNGLIALALVARPEKKKVYAFGALLVFLLNLGFGCIRMCGENKGEEHSATVVQGNVLVDEKWNGKPAMVYCYDLYSELTRNGISQETDIVVWPETAVPINLAKSLEYQGKFKDLSKELGIPIYMGTNWRPENDLYNSAVVVDGDDISDAVSKRTLVPFGEKMPYKGFFEAILPALGQFELTVSNYSASNEARLIETKNGDVGNIICFDSAFPKYSREMAEIGAEVFFIITNDAWLEDSPAAYQHLAHSVFRSVENERYTVRCANVGVSAFIDDRGRITKKLETMERGVLNGTYRLNETKTFYNAFGYMFLSILIGIFLMSCIWCFYSDRKE